MIAKSQNPTRLDAITPSGLPLGDQIASRLGERIIFGEIPPGQRITEESVERWSGASRSPVREAFRLLQRDGLVRRETHRGVTVTRIDGGQLDNLYRIRVVLEAQAAGLAARRGSAPAIRVIEQRHAEALAACEAGDPRVYFRAKNRFSEAVHDAAASEPLREILRIIGGQALRFRFLAYQRSASFTVASMAAAGNILDAIRNRDAARAEALTAALLQESWGRVRALLDDDANPSSRQARATAPAACSVAPREAYSAAT